MNPLRLSIAVCLLASSLHAGQDPAPATPAPTGDEVKFQFSAVQGESARLRIITKTVGSMNLFGATMSQKFSQTFEQEVAMRCIEVRPDRTSVFEMTLPQVAMKMNMGPFKIEVDTRSNKLAPSSQPAFEMINRLFTAMTKVKCTVTFSPAGEPVKVEGLSEGVDAVLKEVSDQLMPGMQQFFDQFREYLADNIMEEQMRSAFRIMPDGGRARVGDKWTREWKVKLPPFNVLTEGKGEYEFLGVEEFRGRPCAKIRVKTSMSTIPGQKPDLSKAGGVPKSIFERMEFSMNASGGNGIAYLDHTNGDLLQMKEMQRTTLEMSMAPDPGAADSELREGLGKITQRLTTTVQIDMIERNGETLLPDDKGDNAAGH